MQQALLKSNVNKNNENNKTIITSKRNNSINKKQIDENINDANDADIEDDGDIEEMNLIEKNNNIDDEADSSNILKKNKIIKSPTHEPGMTTTTTTLNSSTMIPDQETSYCNLCKKGFCNKYFLKSHMSNKHAGLFEPTSTVYLGSTGSMITHFKYSSPKKQQQQPQEANQFTQDKFKLNQNNIIIETPSLIQKQQHHESDGVKMSQENSMHNITEDYCDSCQKHFCNKYYLRVTIILFFLLSIVYFFLIFY